MTTVHDIKNSITNYDSRLGFQMAVHNYDQHHGVDLWMNEVTRETIPIDALVFAEWQHPYTSIELYRKLRCTYDEETNEWLERYVQEMADSDDGVPPVLVHITSDGISLVDGLHRASAFLMFTTAKYIDAWVVS